MNSLRDDYNGNVKKYLIKVFQYSSVMQVPKINKITINMGVGRSVMNKKILEQAMEDLTVISGQKPIVTIARKSIASFKIRQGQSIGCKVTLRGSRMWDFLDRLIFVAIPRIRDFRGLSRKSFDGHGNYSIGIREQTIFPEIDYDAVDDVRGMDITITTSSFFDKEAYMLLTALHFPFRT